MAQIEIAAPAKVNLTLHVTGQRADGYHLLDSLVVFAPDAADRLTLRPAAKTTITVTGPFAAGVPRDGRNLCWRAADLEGRTVEIGLDKHLPHAAGIGGGSSDAAAVLRGMARLFGASRHADVAVLGADVPVCMEPRAQIMAGIGERLSPADIPPLHAVLVNPNVAVPTGSVFAALTCRTNAPMTPLGADFRSWLLAQRNDLEAPAIAVAPVIADVLAALRHCKGVWLARMSGSGATCVGLFDSPDAAGRAAAGLAAAHPDWWIVATDLV